MVSFNNSIMIRNHAGGSAVKDTTKLIETLQKIGVIKGKKKRAKPTLAKEDIKQTHDMGPGYAIETPATTAQNAANILMRNVPLLMNGGDQSGQFNRQQIEDIQRGVGQQFALLKDAMQKSDYEGQQRYQNLLFGTGALAQQVRMIQDQSNKIRPTAPIVEDVEDVDIEEKPFSRSPGGTEPPDEIMAADLEVSPDEIVEEEEQTGFIPPEPEGPTPEEIPAPKQVNPPMARAGRGPSMFDGKAVKNALLALELSDTAENWSQVKKLKKDDVQRFYERLRAVGQSFPKKYDLMGIDDKRFFIAEALEKYGKSLN